MRAGKGAWIGRVPEGDGLGVTTAAEDGWAGKQAQCPGAGWMFVSDPFE